jgi:hypothetical protein
MAVHTFLPIKAHTDWCATKSLKELKMKSPTDLYNEFYKASWANPPSSIIEANKAYLSEDFQNLDKDGNMLMDKETYINSGGILYTAFNDFKYIVSKLREEGDSVIVTGHFEGVHVADIDLSAFGAGVIPASGKTIVWPEVSSKFTFRGEKLVRITNLDITGMGWFLKPLGVELPTA